jgi:glycosyltransferase involved in cell wall biosynthesis
MPSPSPAPLVTVGVPVRNGARFVREALDSALAEDYPNLEILISDNASTDDTEAIGREYAARDRRVRYWRNPENIGAVGNFGRVLAEARGIYFTWLACDDILSHRDYVSRTVAYLEANPDVGICTTDFAMLDLAGPGKVSFWRFPEIYPNQEPAAVRAVYFSWPQSPACFALYGMARRAVLARAPFGGRVYRGRSTVTHWEYPILLAVLKQSRIVALPEVLRTYRRNPESAYHRETDRLAGFDFFLLGLQTKTMLLREALAFHLPTGEKRRLLQLVLRNFLPRTMRSTRGEARRLHAAAEERRQAILRLREVVEERRRIVIQHGLANAPLSGSPAQPVPDDLVAPSPAPIEHWHLPRWAEPVHDAVELLVTDFFRRPSPDRQAKRRADMVDSLVLRQLCDDRLAEIHRLTAEAESYLAIMQQAETAARRCSA